jgi:hypothetical protein
MAKRKAESADQMGFGDAVYLSDLDHDSEAESITKNEIISILYNFMLMPYVNKFESKQAVDVKASEAMKAAEIIVKLKGFDKEEGEAMPDEIELKLP